MTSKNCITCNKTKPLSEFNFHTRSKNQFQPRCKICHRALERVRRKTKSQLVSRIFQGQIKLSKKRNHPPPDYNMLELKKWMFDNPDFDKLFNDWVSSGYGKNKAPSPDRVDDYLPYSLSNLRIVTWAVNNAKHWADRRNGINNKMSKAVRQISLDGDIINTYPSQKFAKRATSISAQSISNCCLGKGKTAGGFKWEFC